MNYSKLAVVVLFLAGVCGLAQGQEMVVAVTAPTPTPTPVNKSALSGRVVQAGTNTPLPRAQVTLQTFGERYEQRKTATDANGQFVFKDLTAGFYTLEARLPGVWPSTLMKQFRAVLPKEGGIRPENASRNPDLTLEDYEQKEVVIELETGGVITGRATFDDGEPVVGTRLMVWRELAAGTFLVMPLGQIELAQTDDRGIYRIEGLPEGRYLLGLMAEARRYGLSDETVLVYYPSAHSSDEAEIVAVASGAEVEGVNFKISTARRRLAGVVKPPAGKKLMNANVTIERKTEKPATAKSAEDPTVFRANYVLESLRGDEKLQPVKTQEANLYDTDKWSFKDLPPGDYRVSVTATLTTQSAWLSRPQPKEGEEGNYYQWREKLPTVELHQAREVSLREGDATDVVLQLTEGGSISGTVRGVGGSLLGAPATVTAYRKWLPGEKRLYETIQARVQPDGTFTLTGLDPAEYWIGAYITDGSETVRNKFYLVEAKAGGLDLTKEWLVLAPQTPISEVNIVFGADAATLRGRLKHNLPGQELRFRICQAQVKPGDPDWYCYDTHWRGAFQVTLPPREYLIFALPVSAGDATSYAEVMQRAAAKALRVTLQPGQTHEIELTLPE